MKFQGRQQVQSEYIKIQTLEQSSGIFLRPYLLYQELKTFWQHNCQMRNVLDCFLSLKQLILDKIALWTCCMHIRHLYTKITWKLKSIRRQKFQRETYVINIMAVFNLFVNLIHWTRRLRIKNKNSESTYCQPLVLILTFSNDLAMLYWRGDLSLKEINPIRCKAKKDKISTENWWESNFVLYWMNIDVTHCPKHKKSRKK